MNPTEDDLNHAKLLMEELSHTWGYDARIKRIAIAICTAREEERGTLEAERRDASNPRIDVVPTPRP